MRRILGPACVALALLVAPATATAACRRSHGPRYEARIVAHQGPRHVIRTALVVCDRRRGLTRVLARAVYRYQPEHGTFLDDAQAAGRRVAWIAGAFRGGRRTATVTVADARTGRRLSRRRVASWGNQHVRPDLSVALTTRGELAWIAPGPSNPRVSQVTLARPGLAPRVIAEGPFLYSLGLEDDRTLRWQGNEGLSYSDIRTAGAGCPHRARFKTVGRLEGLVVTRAVYGDEDSALDAVRVCDLPTGRDPVVASGAYSWGSGDETRVLGGRAPWVVLELDSISRYDGCYAVAVSVVNVRTQTGREASRYARAAGCDAERKTSVVVSDAGAPAWLGDLAGGEQRIAAIAAGGGIVELDRGPSGSLGAPRVEGEAFTWTWDGDPRSAPAP